MCMCSVSQPCPPLCDLMDCNPQDSSVHRIFQARILEWAAISIFTDLLDLGIEPTSLVSPALAGGFLPLDHPGGMCMSIKLEVTQWRSVNLNNIYVNLNEKPLQSSSHKENKIVINLKRAFTNHSTYFCLDWFTSITCTVKNFPDK